MTAFTAGVSDTVGITDTKTALVAKARAATDTVGITDSIGTIHVSLRKTISDTVGITDHLATRWQIRPADTVGIIGVLSSSQNRVQYDTWRPVMRPDNVLILACRTPEGEHDTATGLTHMSLWTFHNDGTNENVVKNIPSTYGWTSYGHPEWSPDGNEVVIYVEDSTTYSIVALDARSYDRGA